MFVLFCFVFFAESVCQDVCSNYKSNLCDYFHFGIIPFMFFNLSQYHIWMKGRFLVHFVNFQRHIILKFELLFVLPLQVYDNCRPPQTADFLQIALISSI